MDFTKVGKKFVEITYFLHAMCAAFVSAKAIPSITPPELFCKWLIFLVFS